MNYCTGSRRTGPTPFSDVLREATAPVVRLVAATLRATGWARPAVLSDPSPWQESESRTLSVVTLKRRETGHNAFPDSLLSASKASRRVAGQIGLPVASVWRRFSAHCGAQAWSCEGLLLNRCCYVAECKIDASVMVTTRRMLHPSPSMPKNKVQHREGRSLARLFAGCAGADQSELACYDGRCPQRPGRPAAPAASSAAGPHAAHL